MYIDKATSNDNIKVYDDLTENSMFHLQKLDRQPVFHNEWNTIYIIIITRFIGFCYVRY